MRLVQLTGARAATISATFPAFIVYWAVTKIPTQYPEAYAQSAFNFRPLTLWSLFAISQFAGVVGVVFLAEDLPSTVVYTLAGWILISLCYYPLRKAFLRRRGIDLDATTADPHILELSLQQK